MVKDAEKKRSLVSGDLAQLAETQVPSLIKDSAQLQVSKVLRGDYDLKIARQDYFTSNQDQVFCFCMGWLSYLQLVMRQVLTTEPDGL